MFARSIGNHVHHPFEPAPLFRIGERPGRVVGAICLYDAEQVFAPALSRERITLQIEKEIAE